MLQLLLGLFGSLKNVLSCSSSGSPEPGLTIPEEFGQEGNASPALNPKPP